MLVRTDQIGLVFKNEKLTKVVEAGVYWQKLWESVELYDLNVPFVSSTPLEVLLTNEALAEELDVIEVSDNELVLQMERGRLFAVLRPGRHVFWKAWNRFTYQKVNTAEATIDASLDDTILMHPSMAYFVRMYKLEVYEKGLLFVDGRFDRILEAGNYIWWKNNIVIHVIKTDIRQQQMDIPGQEILTKDKAQIRVNLNLQYRVTDIVKALYENKDYDKQLYAAMQMAVREIVGSLTLDELMERKELAAAQVLQLAKGRAEALGVTVTDGGLKDIILPGDMRDIMNQVLIAEKRAMANIITRREETASTRSLLNTAKLMEDNAMLYKLKEMEFVERIAENINSISVSGNGQIVDQLKQILIPK
jgi:regulator of protease activity HflC (stomatin/prohibitin superfamily)